MPSKKKKYNARFPPARIKKIMQTDEEVGKVAAAVPAIISRALEMFIESLILKANETTQTRRAKTLSTSHIKQTIENEKKFDFLKDLVVNISDHQPEEDTETSCPPSDQKKQKTSRPRKRADQPNTSSGSHNDRKSSSDSSYAYADEEEDDAEEDDDEETESEDETGRVDDHEDYDQLEDAAANLWCMDRRDVKCFKNCVAFIMCNITLTFYAINCICVRIICFYAFVICICSIFY